MKVLNRLKIRIESIDQFITCFHQFVSRIFSMNFSQFHPLKNKKILLLVQNIFFSVYQLKRNHNKYSKIRDSRLVKPSDEFVIKIQIKRLILLYFKFFKGSGDDCKALCRKTPGCSGYTYVGDENPKYCYLNSDRGI